MRLRLVGLALVALLVTPAIGSAAPITLTFAGAWRFHDAPGETPQFFETMAAYRIVKDTPV